MDYIVETWKDELLWAAAWLYKASGEKEYLNYVSSNEGWSHTVSEFSWDNKFAGAQALLANVLLIIHPSPLYLINYHNLLISP